MFLNLSSPQKVTVAKHVPEYRFGSCTFIQIYIQLGEHMNNWMVRLVFMDAVVGFKILGWLSARIGTRKFIDWSTDRMC